MAANANRDEGQKRVEIRGSDDEDSDGNFSEDSLEDLSSILDRVKPRDGAMPSTVSQRGYAATTPKAKRTANAIHQSPLAIIPKHRFDIKALAKDARKDIATQVSSDRLNALGRASPSSFRETSPTSTVANMLPEEESEQAQKVMRAMQRSKPSAQSQLYRYFNRDLPPRGSKLPKECDDRRWKLLVKGDARTREHNLISGLPNMLISKHASQLPDGIFGWLLDEVCVQKSAIIRQEYSAIIAACPEHVSRVLSVERIQQLLFQLGVEDAQDADDTTEPTFSADEEFYKGRDWACLCTYLSLMHTISTAMPLASIVYTIKALMRMAVDQVVLCNIDLLAQFEAALGSLVKMVPVDQWDNLCAELSSSAMKSFTGDDTKLTALLCVPTYHSRTHDLRKRLAASFLFKDESYAQTAPGSTVSLSRILERLNQRDFEILPKTDFVELRARIMLLDMVVDDGNFKPSEDDDAESKFNQEVDKVAQRLQDLWKKINDSGMKLSRTEAKSVLEWVQKRMIMSVRTRREARKSVFDLPEKTRVEASEKQQKFMENFLRRPAK